MRSTPNPRFVTRLLAATTFTLATSEFMVAGMMPTLAATLQVSVGDIGRLVSVYALGMTVGGPVLTVLLLASRTPGKVALVWLLGLYTAGAFAAAAATSYDALAVIRGLMGVAASACFGVSLTICARLVAPDERGRAASSVLGGLMLAPVLGVPATMLVVQAWGWHAAFWSVAGLSLLCTLVSAAGVPALARDEAQSLAAQWQSLRNRALWAAYATSALVIAATFAAFSYFAPIFTQVSGLAPGALPPLLALYGVANVLGNGLVGRVADRHTRAVLALGLGGLALALTAFALGAQYPAISVAAFLATGFTGVALNPAMVARVMRVAAPGPLVNTLHAALITAGLAFGAWAAGAAIDAGYGLRAALWVGVAFATAGLLSLAWARPPRRADAGCRPTVCSSTSRS